MLMDILLGTMRVLGMAGGVSALVLYHKQNGNGHKPEPNPWRYDPLKAPPAPAPPPPAVEENLQLEKLTGVLAALPKQLETRFELAVELGPVGALIRPGRVGRADAVSLFEIGE